MSLSGFGVANGCSESKTLTSCFASWLSPTSVLNQTVRGTKPSCTSDKKVFFLGAESPSFPNQIRLSAFHFSKVSLLQDQNLPEGGRTFLPDGISISYKRASEPDFADIIVEVQTPRGSLSGFEYPVGISSVRGKRFGLQIFLFFAYTRIKS